MLQQTACSTGLGGAECASSCARTLGCRSWRLLTRDLARDRECCLGLEAPENGGEGFEHGEVLHPCERGCLAFGQPSISNVSLDDVPWLRVQHQLETPLAPPEPESEPGSAGSAGAAKTAGPGRSPRVAVCLAGQARTLVEPAVWHSIRDLLLERGRHALFMVLGTGGETSTQQHADHGAPDACALQHELN